MMVDSIKQGVQDGLLGEGIFPCTSTAVYTTVDPRRPNLAGGRFPAVRVFKDVCLGCGYEHIVRIESGYAITSANPNKPAEFR